MFELAWLGLKIVVSFYAVVILAFLFVGIFIYGPMYLIATVIGKIRGV
jgi:hypothetical protein